MRVRDVSWRQAIRTAFGPFVVSRASVLLAGLIGALLVGYDPPPTELAAWRVSPHVLANLPARWDAYWYLDIAAGGYEWQADSPYQQNVVFFPAYPMLLRAAGWVCGRQILWGGVAVSLAAFLAALVGLARLAARDLGHARAGPAVWLLASYPFAVFFGAPYTESLFLLALVSAWLGCRERRYGWTAIGGLVLGLTRPNGFLVSLPLWCLVLQDLGWQPTRGLAFALPSLRGRTRAATAGLVAATMPVVGMLIYSAYLGWTVGEPFAWITGQSAWGLLSSGMTTAIDPRWGPPLPWRWSDLLVHAGDVLATLFALAAIVPIHRRLGLAYALLVALAVVPPLLAHGILSMGRFTSVLFPLFLWLAAAIPAGRIRTWTRVFLAGQWTAAALFYSWRILV